VTFDLSKMREDAAKLEASPRTPESGTVVEPAQPSDVAAARRSLQDQRGALNAEAAPPGQEPEADPIDKALHAGRQYARGSDQAMEAYAQEIFNAAQAGDPRVVSQGVVDSDTRERWAADAHSRQVANRDQSGMAHR
jgi:hypothetical protein